jgi:hypothetical protein
MDPYQLIHDSILRLLTQNASLFESMGMTLFYAFAAIMLSWFGVQSALAGSGFPWAKFTALLQQLLFCYVMLAFYTVPIPGLGISFTHLILDQVQSMMTTLNQTSVQGVMETLNGLDNNLPYPAPYEVISIIRFFILELCIVAAQAVTLVVTMFGFVATAIIILLGPLFIPFKIVPEMEWMFWGWFRAFIQYAFYQLIATAYVFVFGDFLTRFLGTKGTGLSGSDMAVLFVPLVLVLVTFALGMTKVPALTFSIFSGRAGEYVMLRWR